MNAADLYMLFPKLSVQLLLTAIINNIDHVYKLFSTRALPSLSAAISNDIAVSDKLFLTPALPSLSADVINDIANLYDSRPADSPELDWQYYLQL